MSKLFSSGILILNENLVKPWWFIILVFSGCYDKLPYPGWLIQQLLFTFLEARETKVKVVEDQFLVRAFFMVYRLPPTQCELTWQKEGNEIRFSSSLKGAIPFLLWGKDIPDAGWSSMKPVKPK